MGNGWGLAERGAGFLACPGAAAQPTMVNVNAENGLTGLILAGGKSTRFGSDKASALVAGRPMLQWVTDALSGDCERLVIVRAAGQILPPLEIRCAASVVEDRWEARGPLAGLASGFPVVETEYCFATSCDAPLVQPDLIRALARLARGHDIALVEAGGRLNPLMAVYRPATCLPAFEQAVERSDLKITVAFAGLDVVVMEEARARTFDPGLLSLVNANRPEALAEVESLLSNRPVQAQ